ncbi:hypothetical protein [Streptomyces lavendofoliae]|uniref:hypothetical protein n=1 Tax=Streptomyces lavendofoliae TaxID=67314 RepID=UPI003D8FDF64
MNTTMITARTEADRPSAATIPGGSAGVLPADHRFALLTALAGLEPKMAQRYTTDPASVLAEFGPAAEPVYGGGDFVRELVIEDLDRPGAADGLAGCRCYVPLAREAGMVRA